MSPSASEAMQKAVPDDRPASALVMTNAKLCFSLPYVSAALIRVVGKEV